VLDLSVQTDAFNNAVTRYVTTLGKDSRAAIRYQSMLLAKRLVQFTPPKTRSQGRKAVKRDIERAVTPIRPSDFSSKSIRKLIRARDYAALEVIFSRFERGAMAGFAVVPFTPELHTKRRDRRGRVRKSAKVASPDAKEVKAYVAEVQTRVGRGKSGWAKAVTQLGGNVPAWLAKHSGTGVVQDQTRGPDPWVRMRNQSEWARGVDTDVILSNALRSRQRDIVKSIEKTIRDASRKSRLKR
jgi:hypothetical protein